MRAKKIGRIAAIAACAALGLWLFVGVLLPVFLPLFVGLAVAALAKRPVAALQKKAGLPRGLAAFFCVLGIYALAGTGLFSCAGSCAAKPAGFFASCRNWPGGWRARLRRWKSGSMPSRTNSQTAWARGFARA